MAKSRKRRPATAAPKITVDLIIHNCLVWYGIGTGSLPTRLDAIEDLVEFFRPRFESALAKDPQRWTDVDPQHTLERLFVLRCTEAIGRLAAQKATKDGEVSIATRHVREARDAVISANTDRPGDWCN